MRIIRTPVEMHEWTRDNVSRNHLARKQVVGFVPTMGALHAGHARLFQVARGECDIVVASIFVNSLQFNRSDDFDAYPRTFESDVAVCESEGVDVVYAPDASSMYSESFQTHVVPGAVASNLEGEGRPGHFTGVTTVVTKLFNAVMPRRAYFGEKDFQQLVVIKRMVSDLDFGIDIVPVPTVREPDGLALSSRNVRLSAADRAAAPVLHRALRSAQDEFEAGERNCNVLRHTALSELLLEPRARIEYVRVVDPATCEDIENVADSATIALAAWFGDVRLIDNVALSV